MPKGYKFTPEQLQHMSDSHKGIKQSQESIEKRRQKLIGRESPMKGKKHKEESKQKIKETFATEESKKKRSEAHKGQKAWNKGQILSEEERAEISRLTKLSVTMEGRLKNSLRTRGENGPGYIDGRSINGKKSRGSDWFWIRARIKERDNFTCQSCGLMPPKQIQVHHIHPYEETHENNPCDLISLCVACHRRVESGLLCLMLRSLKDKPE